MPAPGQQQHARPQTHQPKEHPKPQEQAGRHSLARSGCGGACCRRRSRRGRLFLRHSAAVISHAACRRSVKRPTAQPLRPRPQQTCGLRPGGKRTDGRAGRAASGHTDEPRHRQTAQPLSSKVWSAHVATGIFKTAATGCHTTSRRLGGPARGANVLRRPAHTAARAHHSHRMAGVEAASERSCHRLSACPRNRARASDLVPTLTTWHGARMQIACPAARTPQALAALPRARSIRPCSRFPQATSATPGLTAGAGAAH